MSFGNSDNEPSPGAADSFGVKEWVAQAGQALFAPTLLTADPPLWGSFWQFDVISPGYLLPLSELALLRAVRLDKQWPEDTDTSAFIADLRRAVKDPRSGVWTLILVDTPFVVFVSPPLHLSGTAGMSGHFASTVVWYGSSSNQYHAGYRLRAIGSHVAEMKCRRSPRFEAPDPGPGTAPYWLSEAIVQRQEAAPTPENRLDEAILRWRLR
jgi:hypothetical protein